MKQSSTESSVSLDSLDEISIPSVHPRTSGDDGKSCLCSSCCHCNTSSPESQSSRDNPIPQISLFYAPPTFIRELCGITAFSSNHTCRHIRVEECDCHKLWIGFFDEVLGAYADRYTDTVNYSMWCSLDSRDYKYALFVSSTGHGSRKLLCF